MMPNMGKIISPPAGLEQQEKMLSVRLKAISERALR